MGAAEGQSGLTTAWRYGRSYGDRPRVGTDPVPLNLFIAEGWQGQPGTVLDGTPSRTLPAPLEGGAEAVDVSFDVNTGCHQG